MVRSSVSTRLDDRLTIIAFISIAFAAVGLGSPDFRFGVALVFTAFIAFQAGCRWERGPRAINAGPRAWRRMFWWVQDRWYRIDWSSEAAIVSLIVLVFVVVVAYILIFS